jgi:hypothetical protein
MVQGGASGSAFKVYGDNTGVVEGWWKGRSRNWPTNLVFRRIHRIALDCDSTFHTRYVVSDSNPADNPSRGKYPRQGALLPTCPIPPDLRPFIINYDEPLTESERLQHGVGRMPLPAAKPTISRAERNARIDANSVFQQQGDEIKAYLDLWDTLA